VMVSVLIGMRLAQLACEVVAFAAFVAVDLWFTLRVVRAMVRDMERRVGIKAVDVGNGVQLVCTTVMLGIPK